MLYNNVYSSFREVSLSQLFALIVPLLVAPAKIKFFVNLLGSRSQEKLKSIKSLVAKLKGLFGGCKGEAVRISYKGENEPNKFLMS